MLEGVPIFAQNAKSSMNTKVEEVKRIVKDELSCSVHDMDHVFRVFNIAMKLARDEEVDMEVLQVALYLHDIARVKEDKDQSGRTDHALLGAEMSREILKNLKYSDKFINHVVECILSHRYKTGVKPSSIEAKILFDADKLDSVGAVGIARMFMWLGAHKAPIYKKVDIEEYAKDNLGGDLKGKIHEKHKHSAQIEFETKYKNITDSLYTKKARELGQERVEYFKKYLDRLEDEVLGRV